MPRESVYLERAGAIARLVLNRPDKRNALDLAMWEAIPALAADADADPAVKLLLVQGVDASAFAAGADIGEFDTVLAGDEGKRRYNDAVRRAEAALEDCAKPVIAMIRGDCVGGGVELALACDLRFAGADSRFGVPAARLGIVYPLVATRGMVALMGPAKTKDLLFTGRLIDAAEAERIGLIDRVFTPEAVERETLAFAETVCRGSQFSVRAAKRVVAAILAGETAETAETTALRMEGFGGEDNREGVKAFLAKRRPNFTWKG